MYSLLTSSEKGSLIRRDGNVVMGVLKGIVGKRCIDMFDVVKLLQHCGLVAL